MRRQLAGILLGGAIALSGGLTTTVAQDQPSNGVLGVAEAPLLARYHPDFAAVCAIEPNENTLAVAQTGDYYLVYAGGFGCEGPVWLPSDAPVTWSNETALADLETVPAPSATPITEVDDYDALCDTASSAESAGIDPATIDAIFIPGGFGWFPPRFLATEDTPPTAIVCVDSAPQSLGVCANLNIRVERFQDQTTVYLLSYPTGGLIAAQRFSGDFPDDCPSAANREYSINGSPVGRDVWAAWLLNRLGAGGGETGLRTTTAVPRLNARALDNTQSDILQILEGEVAVSFIARNEAGTWGVALLPDMTQAWLFSDFVNIAAQTDFEALPVVSGPAVAVEIPLP